jgi:ribosomal protein S18 acetylase RimI-like enzyme
MREQLLNERPYEGNSMFAPITDEDVPRIVILMNRAYRGAGKAGWSTQESYLSGDRITEDVLRADLLAKPRASLLKWQDSERGPLLGCVWIEPLNNDMWYLGSLAADPTRQNSGLGKTLLSAAEQWARERGGKRIRMTVVSIRQALIAWYLRRGYHKTGESEPFPYGDDRFGAPLRDDLSFLVLEKDLTPSDSGI